MVVWQGASVTVHIRVPFANETLCGKKFGLLIAAAPDLLRAVHEVLAWLATLASIPPEVSSVEALRLVLERMLTVRGLTWT